MPTRSPHPAGRLTRAAALPALLALAALTACSASGEDTAEPVSTTAGASPSGVYDENLADHPTRFGTVGPGFPTPSTSPAPGSTFSPSPNAWSDVRPPAGYTVTMVAPAGDPQAAVVVDAVRSWAAAESVDLSVVTVADPKDNLADLSQAMQSHPDLLVTAGDSLVDAMALVTASAQDIRFLILGGEIAEPTSNVTAVDWDGAGFRGEGLGQATHHDPSSFTPARAGRAIRAGVAAVLTNWSGFVLWIR